MKEYKVKLLKYENSLRLKSIKKTQKKKKKKYKKTIKKNKRTGKV